MNKIVLVILSSLVSLTLFSQDKITIPVSCEVAVKPLVEHWAQTFEVRNKQVDIVVQGINQEGTIRVSFESSASRNTEGSFIIGKTALLPIAHHASRFALQYSERGLDRDALRKTFFDDIFNEKGDKQLESIPYLTYSSLSKDGLSEVFAHYFEYESSQFKGKAIAGNDQHVVTATTRDTLGVSFGPLSLIYDPITRASKTGLAVIPVDFMGSNRVSDEERIFTNLDVVITTLETISDSDLRNIPMAYVKVDFDRGELSTEAQEFLNFIAREGSEKLHQFGFMTTEATPVDLIKNQDVTAKAQ